ncbi:hypothetical protein LPJ53_006477 [Coemansia erecta]|uniref:Nicotinamide-nucleotide adenylyltransferase n=1 Tax=Coemansia erecta TaxID=147472 RepID=A0A9W7XT45_9FUNG|nr:hypothetical protein LPJ53_006477 [Coemansia erecta]
MGKDTPRAIVDAEAKARARAQAKEQQQAEIDLMSTLQCDTPLYDDFVGDFLSEYTDKACKPTAMIARKFCDTWPIPRERPADHSSDTEAAEAPVDRQGGGGEPDASPHEIRIGVMDSSFNPPHYCHGALMECLGTMELTAADRSHRPARILDIDAFLLLLGSENADKRHTGASLEQRMRMVDMLATTISQDTSADTWHVWKCREHFDQSNLHNLAIGMVNTPRFVDKCSAVRDAVRQEWSKGTGQSAASLEVLCYFAMGWDTLIRFFDPKYYADYATEINRFFASGGRIAYARRGGISDKAVAEFFAREDIQVHLACIFELVLPKRVRHISSTDVRLAVRDSTQSVRDIPPRILEFVNNCRLYRTPGKKVWTT